MHVRMPSVIDALLSVGVAARLTHLDLHGSSPGLDEMCQGENDVDSDEDEDVGAVCSYAAYQCKREEDRQNLRRLLAACSGLRNLAITFVIGSDLTLALDALKRSGARLSTLSLGTHDCRNRTGSEAVILALQAPTHPVLTRPKVLAVNGGSDRLKQPAREMRVRLMSPEMKLDWWPRWQ